MKIDTKLNIGQECFYLKNNKVVSFVIENIQIEIKKNGTNIIYLMRSASGDSRYESDVFATKQELLDSL